MPAGRKPKPTYLKVLQGNPGRRPLSKGEPKPKRAERAPSIPTWLEDEARVIWKRHARSLWELRLLTEIDVDAYATLCETTALYRTAVDMIRKEGVVWTNADTGYSQQSGWVSVRNNSLKQMQSLWSEFGMTPAARARIDIKDAGEKEADPLDALLKRHASG